jgi:hypothetical protein
MPRARPRVPRARITPQLPSTRQRPERPPPADMGRHTGTGWEFLQYLGAFGGFAVAAAVSLQSGFDEGFSVPDGDWVINPVDTGYRLSTSLGILLFLTPIWAAALLVSRQLLGRARNRFLKAMPTVAAMVVVSFLYWQVGLPAGGTFSADDTLTVAVLWILTGLPSLFSRSARRRLLTRLQARLFSLAAIAGVILVLGHNIGFELAVQQSHGYRSRTVEIFDLQATPVTVTWTDARDVPPEVYGGPPPLTPNPAGPWTSTDPTLLVAITSSSYVFYDCVTKQTYIRLQTVVNITITPGDGSRPKTAYSHNGCG